MKPPIEKPCIIEEFSRHFLKRAFLTFLAELININFLNEDNGIEFVNKTIRESTEKFEIRHTKTPKYYSEASPTERYNRTIKQIITAYLENNHATWDDNVDDHF